MSADCMTHEQLVKLTGRSSFRWQRDWLKKRGWRFETNAAGAPRVAVGHFERKMGCEPTTAEPPPAAKHNFGALKVVK